MSDSGKVTTQELMDIVKSKSKGKYWWPKDLHFEIHGDSVMISVDNKILQEKGPRLLDPWGLAFIIEVQERCGLAVKNINFAITGQVNEMISDKRQVPKLEALCRRISFLSINNPGINFKMTINGKIWELYKDSTLFKRPDQETIREEIKSRKKNLAGRLEKDFQQWLYAEDVKGLRNKNANTNERLAVLGEDFLSLEKRDLGILREFPTGVFDRDLSQKPSEKSRILPTEFVDIVTLNKHGQLAVIELKLNDPDLAVIAQLMDYALFFRCYRDKIWPIVKDKLHPLRITSKDVICCYVVNNHFHSRFDKVMKYYRPKDTSFGFKIIKVILGYYA